MATDRVFRLRQDVESAATRTEKLATILRRDEWRTEQASLKATHGALDTNLKAHAKDANASERAQEHYDAATTKLGEITATLENVKEPSRSVPPVSGEEAIEPSIIDRSAVADDVLAWVARLGESERRTLIGRVEGVGGGSVNRTDGFVVALSNYFGTKPIRSQFLEIAKNPRRFNRAAYEQARASANANANANANATTDENGGVGDVGERVPAPAAADAAPQVRLDLNAMPAAASSEHATPAAASSAHATPTAVSSAHATPAAASSAHATPAAASSAHATPAAATHATPAAATHATPAAANSAHAAAAASTHATTAAGTHAAQATPGAAHRPALDRALALTQLGTVHLEAIRTELVPAYRRAVAAMDSAAVKALALQIVGGVARIVDAQAHVVRLVPQVDTGPHAAMTSTSETDAFAPNTAELGTLTAEKAALDTAVLATVPKLAVQVSPQWFGDQLVAGRAAEPPPHVREVLVQLTYEAGLVVQLLDEADTIAKLLQPVNEERGTSEPAPDGSRSEAAEHLERWRSRPINFLFLARVLTERGLWQSMQGIKNVHGHTAAELQRKVFAQSKETGTTADVGALWDADEAHGALSYGTTDWKVTGEEASRVFEMLAQAEPRARGELVKQLYRMGRLGALCEHLPWGQVKQLWESIQDPEASKLLEPYWDGKGGGKSLGKRLEEQDHWYTDALNKFLDITTFGAKPRIDAAHDAREAGLISDDAYWSSVTKAVGRAAFVAAATAATGGVAGELVAGASEGMGLATGMAGKVVTTIAGGATAGGMGNVAGHFIGDAYDQILDGKEGFDSMSAYGDSFKEGAALGGVTAAVGLAASRFMPKGMRTLAQETAAAHPKLTRLLEAARSVGVGAGTRVQTTVHEFLEWFGSGGAPPGFRLAYAVAGGVVPPRIASASPGATVWVTVRPLQDLNAPRPMQMHGTGDVVEIENVELSKEVADMFDELSGAERYTHPDEASFAGEGSRLGESGPELDAIRTSSTRTKAGVVEREGQVHTDQHHMFPQEKATWFKARGVDVDDWCIDLTPPEHQAQHGGGNWRLARRVAKELPDAEWNAGIMDRLLDQELKKQQLTRNPQAKLTPDEILRVGRRFMRERELGDAPLRRYER